MLRSITTLAVGIASADAFTASCANAARGGAVAARRAAVCTLLEPRMPPGYASMFEPGNIWYDGEAAAETATAVKPSGEPVEAAVVEGVVTPTQPAAAKAEAPKAVVTDQGLFAPLVLGAKAVMGEQELKELRAAVIAKHSKVIANFVDTSESPFGQLVLRRMFEYADKDGNGTLDKAEVQAALYDLGFDFLNEKDTDKIVKKADKDKNEVIDFEEFVKETPKVLRVNLVKLAKSNGHDLGFLV